jgi:hypothetical protein
MHASERLVVAVYLFEINPCCQHPMLTPIFFLSACQSEFVKRCLLDLFARPLLHGKVVSVLALHNLGHGFESGPNHGVLLRVGGARGPDGDLFLVDVSKLTATILGVKLRP